MTTLKNNDNKHKLRKSRTEISQPKRNSDGKWPIDLTPQQVGMMSAEDAGDYMTRLFLDTLNRATSKLKENTSLKKELYDSTEEQL